MRTLHLLPLLLICASAHGATYFVATNGNDSTGDGSIGNPWATIRHGLSTMSGGDTLNVRTGTYGTANIVAEFKSGPDVGQDTVVQAYNGEAVLYEAPSNVAHAWQISGKSNIFISGIEINGQHQQSTGLKITSGSHHITITNCIVRDTPGGHGIHVSGVNDGDDAHTLITHCTVFNNGWNPDVGDSPLHQFYIQTSTTIVENCLIEGNEEGSIGYGIHHFGADCHDNHYRNNIVRNTLDTGIGIMTRARDCFIYNNLVTGGGSWGINVTLSTNVWVLNNTCYTNNAQIQLLTSTNCVVENNIVVGGYASNPGGLYINGVNGVVIRNNMGYGSYVSGVRTWDYRVASSSGLTVANNLFSNPDGGPLVGEYDAGFVNIAASNFQLQSTSQAISEALSQSLFTDDITGTARSGTWDIGAYEYTGRKKAKIRRSNP